MCVCVCVSLSLSLSLSLSQICIGLTLPSLYVAKFYTVIVLFVCLKMYFSLLRVFVSLFDVLSVAVFVIRDRFAEKPTCA